MAKRKIFQLKTNRQKRLGQNLGWKKLLAVAAIIYLSALTVLQAFPGLFAKFDDPARLGATVQILTTNGFTLRWAEKMAATNDAGFDLIFVHGTPGGAGVWAAQFARPFPGANLLAFDRPGFGK